MLAAIHELVVITYTKTEIHYNNTEATFDDVTVNP